MVDGPTPLPALQLSYLAEGQDWGMLFSAGYRLESKQRFRMSIDASFSEDEAGGEGRFDDSPEPVPVLRSSHVAHSPVGVG